MRAHAPSPAIALLLTAAAACTLSQAGRDRCQSDRDCNPPRVCAAGSCVAPGTGGTSGTGIGAAGTAGTGAGGIGGSGTGGVGGAWATGTGGNASDAGDAAAGPCAPSLPFGEPRLVPGLNTPAGVNAAARFSPDERTAYWAVFTGLTEDLATASRDSISEPFDGKTTLDALNTGYRETNPFVTEDGLSLYFDSDRSPVGLVYVSTRMRASDAFGTLQLVTELGAYGDGTVYFPSGNDVVYFHSARAVSNVNLYKGERRNGGFTVTPLAVNSTANEYCPVLPADELSVYFAVGRPRLPSEPYNWDMYLATRSSRDADFGAPVAIDNLNMPGADEAPSWISPDGCRLYFTRNDPASGQWVYVAEKTR